MIVGKKGRLKQVVFNARKKRAHRMFLFAYFFCQDGAQCFLSN